VAHYLEPFQPSSVPVHGGSNQKAGGDQPPLGNHPCEDHHHRAGAVYTMTNATGGNMVEAFARSANGTLTSIGLFSTGGYGSGALGFSQGSVRLAPDARVLSVVNVQSDQVTTFGVEADGRLLLLNTVASGGRFPVSVTLGERFAYVLNGGDTQNVAAFAILPAGLGPVAGARFPLSFVAAGPAEVRLSPGGERLVVPEKFSNTLDTFSVSVVGTPFGPTLSPSNGVEPFGLVWNGNDRLLVTDATTNAVTLYAVNANGTLTAISGPVPNGQVAPCWIVLTADARFAYTDNAGSGTISAYRVTRDSIALLQGVAATIGGTPIDIALSADGHYLYALNGETITGFRVNADGTLSQVSVVDVTPNSIGLAAY
jgi:6-phosphogluconolactonase